MVATSPLTANSQRESTGTVMHIQQLVCSGTMSDGEEWELVASQGEGTTDWATELKFWINGSPVVVEHPNPTATLLEWLREDRGITSVHTGCGDGGCGICTVALCQVSADTTKTVSINSCLRRLCAVDGCHVITTEGLGCKRDGFHPIQSAIADGNGSQCGYCTPGWVMQMYSLLANAPAKPTAKEVEQNFDGMLCRCTGYRPILTALGKFADRSHGAKQHAESPSTARGKSRCCGDEVRDSEVRIVPDPEGFRACEPRALHFVDALSGAEYFRPTTMVQLGDAVASLTQRQRNLRVLCAGTADCVDKYLRGDDHDHDHDGAGESLVDVSALAELQAVQVSAEGAEFGSAVSIAGLIRTLQDDTDQRWSEVASLLRRVGSVQVRAVASWAGNLMLTRKYPAFPSDVATVLATVGASVTAVSVGAGLGPKQELSVPELLASSGPLLLLSVAIPRLPPTALLRIFKTAPRHVLSQSTVNFGACITFGDAAVDGRAVVASASVVVGGACDRLLVATETAKCMAGKTMDQTCFDAAGAALAGEVAAAPSAEPRSSPSYRAGLVQTFLYKLFLAAHPALPAPFASAIRPFVAADARPVSTGTESFGEDTVSGPVSGYVPKLQAREQASGEVSYPSDLGLAGLAAQPVLSRRANATLEALDASAAGGMRGVKAFVGAEAIPGLNCVNGAKSGDCQQEKLFWAQGDLVPCVGSMLGVVVADTADNARRAAACVVQRWSEPAGVVGTLEQARDTGGCRSLNATDAADAAGCSSSRRGVRRELVGGIRCDATPPHLGETALLSHAESQPEEAGVELQSVSGSFGTGGQRHWYMETQAAWAVPVDGDGWEVTSSDQDASFSQRCLAALLGVSAHKINVRVPRAGGGFGGKLTRQLLASGAAVVAARAVGQAVRVQLDRCDDMRMVGGREPMTFQYEVTFSAEGRVDSLDMDMTMDAGWYLGDAAEDLAMAVGFSDNVYSYRRFTVTTHAAVTHTPHNTSVRAPGCLQSIIAAEVVMEHVARAVGKSVREVQELNMYDPSAGPVCTPFGDHLGEGGFNWTIPALWSGLQAQADVSSRQDAVAAFNKANRYTKKGLALAPVKYAMRLDHYSSGAQVNVYADGSVLVSVGGSEIGQGLNTKVALCVAQTLGVPLSAVSVGPRQTSVVPNNSGTGGSGTSECSAAAAMRASQDLARRLLPFRAPHRSFEEAVAAALEAGVSLMAAAWFKAAPGGVNSDTYATYGAACSEVMVDVLTGEVRVERLDVAMDLGTQLDAAVDIGQLQGGVVMALGYLLTEELQVDAAGAQLNLGSWHYKIPTPYDIPLAFNVALLQHSPNPTGILGSKASAEPAMPLVAAVYLAVKEAVYAARAEMGGSGWFGLDLPLTPQRIRDAIGTQTMTVPP